MFLRRRFVDPLDDHIAFGPGIVDIAFLELGIGDGVGMFGALIGAGVFVAVLVQDGRVRLERFFRVENGGQLLVFDLDQLKGLAGDFQCIGGNSGDRLADIAHLVAGEGHLVLQEDADIFLFRQILGRDDRAHAFERLGFGSVDRADTCMGVRGAQHRGVQHARQGHVIGVYRLAGEFLTSLETRHRFPDRVPDRVGRDDTFGAHDLPPSVSERIASTTFT